MSRSSFSVLFAALVVAACIIFVADAQRLRPPPPTERRFIPDKYNEVIDLLLDAARLSCDTLGELIIAPDFSYKLRCELFLEQAEELGSMCDSMVGEIKLTQKQMVQNAIDGGYDRDLVGYMKKAIKKVMGSRRASEREVSHELHKDMSQWILDVSVHEMGKPRKSSKMSTMGSGGASFHKMTAPQRAKLREMGLAMPSEEEILSDNAARSSEKSLVVIANDDDRQWAEEVSEALSREKKQRGMRKGRSDEELSKDR